LNFARIAGTGGYLPDRVLTNHDLEKMVDTTDRWIRERTGIGKRHIARDGQNTVDLAEYAARRALDAAGRDPRDVDLIIVATTTPDRVFPSTACLLQKRLDLHGCAAFDIQAVCTGFVYALGVADKFVRCGASQCALVVGAETLSRILDWSDRSTCVLFGDGAGAVVLKPSEEPGILSSHLGADGQYQELLYYPVGVSNDLAAAGVGDSRILMSGNDVFKVAVKTLSAVAEEALEANGVGIDDLDWFVPHQANLRIIQATAKRLGVSMDKVIQTVQIHGNTSAASIPMAFDVAVRDGRIQRDQLVLFDAFGGGFTWGSVLLRY
jgi:3-oxoacyl-[acyl-carrier-protein] synthase-3